MQAERLGNYLIYISRLCNSEVQSLRPKDRLFNKHAINIACHSPPSYTCPHRTQFLINVKERTNGLLRRKSSDGQSGEQTVSQPANESPTHNANPFPIISYRLPVSSEMRDSLARFYSGPIGPARAVLRCSKSSLSGGPCACVVMLTGVRIAALGAVGVLPTCARLISEPCSG